MGGDNTIEEPRVLSMVTSWCTELRLRHNVAGFNLEPAQGGVFNLRGIAERTPQGLGRLTLYGPRMQQLAEVKATVGMTAEQAISKLLRRLPPGVALERIAGSDDTGGPVLFRIFQRSLGNDAETLLMPVMKGPWESDLGHTAPSLASPFD